MKFEMNIGLDVAGGANRTADINNRADVAIRHLKRVFDKPYIRRYESEYEGPNGIVLESGLFVSVETNIRASWTIFGAAEALAKHLEQDCIAVYLPLCRFGKLVGPKAEAWGDFKIEYFKRFEPEVV